MTKETYVSHTSSSTFKKATPASAYLKNYFDSDSNFLLFLHNPGLNQNNLYKVSCLVSVSILQSLVSSRSRYPKVSSRSRSTVSRLHLCRKKSLSIENFREQASSKQSRLRRLKNGVPQESVSAPLLVNIYTYDLPSMIYRKFAYADDLALLHSSGNWKDLERTLSQDMSTLSAYLQTWRLKLSHSKTVTAAFYLNNREAKRELKVYNKGVQTFFQEGQIDNVKVTEGQQRSLKKRSSLRFDL